MYKLFEKGLGSSYLHDLNIGDTISARMIENKNFHLPQSANKIALIANGTGIAPFLGMILENSKQKEVHLYVGFRYNNSLTQAYQQFADAQIKKQRLTNIHFAYSREENKQYVMDLIQRESDYFCQLLQENGIIMLCGSLAMQKDVEIILNTICLEKNGHPLQYYIDNKQILTDCY